MRRQPKITWTENQYRELLADVRKFNAKITRMEKENPALAEYLPKRADINKLRKTITTDKDLKRFTASVNRFMKPKAVQPITTEKGVKTTKWQDKENKLNVKRINKQRSKERETTSAPTTQGGTMGTEERNAIKDKKYELEKIAPSDWDMFVETVENMARENYTAEGWEDYKGKYLEQIELNLGAAGSKLYYLIEGLDAEFISKHWRDDADMLIRFAYDEQQTIQDRADAAYDAWIEVIQREMT